MASSVPIIIGVGDVKNPSTSIADAREPLHLILSAIHTALLDSHTPTPSLPQLQSHIDSISVVRTWTWPYADLPGLLAVRLGAAPRHKEYSAHGGNQPAKLLDEAARRIAQGEARVAVFAGGEALASLTACAKAQKLPPPGWTPAEDPVEAVFSPTSGELGDDLGAVHSIGAPIHVYPLYENGFRAHRRQSIDENNRESARLYAEFARVAQKHPYAWNFGKPAETETSIGEVSKRNRMICFPYPLLMNAFNTVNLAAACVLTSTGYARQLGIPESRWIYPLGGAGTEDSEEFWERPNFYSSPSINLSLDAALQVSGLCRDQIDLLDLYSCFPIVPKLAAHHLGIPIANSPKPLTLLGGLTSFGGAGNNYSMHAVTEMVRQLRDGKGQYGLILANGGVLSYQHAVCLSRRPRSGDSPYPETNPLAAGEKIERKRIEVPVVEIECEGKAVVETYTVEFNRDNTPLRGHVVGRLTSSGHRFLANHGDEGTLRQLASGSREPIGRVGVVRLDGEASGRNLFSFDAAASL